jgi:proteasome lid subunit RPN8/RPN11
MVDWQERTVWYTRNLRSNKRLLLIAALNGFFLSGRIMQDGEVFIQAECWVRAWTRRSQPKPRFCMSVLPFRPETFLNAPLIPHDMILTAKSFFREVYRHYRSEAMVQLLYNRSDKQWAIRPLHQKVSSQEVEHEEREDVPPGWQAVGIIHSHGNYPAGHSHTDNANEVTIDGIYITVGKVNAPWLDISASITVCGYRFLIPSQTLIDLREELPPHPSRWMAYVQYVQKPVFTPSLWWLPTEDSDDTY